MTPSKARFIVKHCDFTIFKEMIGFMILQSMINVLILHTDEIGCV